MRANRKLMVLATVALLGCTSARAQMYLGAGLGQAHLKAMGERNFDVKSKSDTRKFYIGSNFGKHFGMEFSYIDFGFVRGELHRGLSTSIDSIGYGPFAVGRIPIKFVEPFVKVGYVRFQSDILVASLGLYDPSSYGFAYGGGVGFNPVKHLNIRAEYERFQFPPIFGGFEPETDLYMISVSLAWRF